MIKIEWAAIEYKDLIHLGVRHNQIGLDMIRRRHCDAPYPSGKAQGFFTSEGDFVSREEAFKIAIAAGQIEEGETIDKYRLFSEDLW